MARIREIKNRRKAVGTIQRITKTMQMIATAKFTAAVQRTNATKPYTKTIGELVSEVASAAGDVDHPLLNARTEKVGRELLLVISSDRGLCGAYNANVLRNAIRHYRSNREAGLETAVEASGKKGLGFFKFQGVKLSATHMVGDKPAYEDVERIAASYIERFSAGEFDAVRVAYMRYESNARQVPELLQLLPLQREQDDEQESKGGASANYEFSPSSEELLANLIPLAIKSQLFQCFNDAVVSEQIMRMIAMKAATDNARDLGRLLARQFNRARQAQITTELTEIVSGAAALE